MEAAAFDALLNSYTSDTFAPPTVSDQKEIAVESAYNNKREQIEPRRIESLDDGDSGTFSNGNGFRQQGIDTYETLHQGSSGTPLDVAAQRRMDRQRLRYSQEFNKTVYDVTNEDVYEQGAKKGLENLYNIGRDQDTKPWTPGDTSYYRTSPLELGSKETPLDLAVNARINGEGKYGRKLTKLYNVNDGSDINAQQLTGNNAAIYGDNGEFNKKATVEANIEAGGATLLERALGIGSNGDRQYQTNDGLLGESIDIAQSGATRSLADYINMADMILPEDMKKSYNKYAKNVSEFFGGDGSIGVTYDQGPNGEKRNFLGTGKNLEDFRGDSAEAVMNRDIFTGVNADVRKEMSVDMENAAKDWKNKNYGSSIISIAKNIPYLLAESAPEIGELMLPGGIALVTAKRTSNQLEKFEANNGRKASFGEMTAIATSVAATLAMEKALVKSGVSGAIGNRASKIGLGGRTGAVAGSAGGEAIQEYSEGVQEAYATQKIGDRTLGDIATDSDQVFQGAVGGLMGGALRGAGEVGGVAYSAPSEYRKNKETKRQQDIGEYLVGDEAELATALDEMSFKDVQDYKESITNAEDTIADYGSVEEMLNSDNPEIRRVAQNIEKETKGEIEVGSRKHQENIARKIENDIKDISTLEGAAREEAQGYIDSLNNALNIDVTKSSKEEIQKAIEYVSSDADTQELYEFMDVEKTRPTVDDIVGDYGGFETLRTNIKKTFKLNRKSAEAKVNEVRIVNANFKKGQEKAPKEKEIQVTDANGNTTTEKAAGVKKGAANASRIEKETKRTGLARLLDTLTSNNRGKTAAMKELNKYSNEALDAELENKDTSTRIKNTIKAVKAKRKASVRAGGIDRNTDFKARGTNLKKGDRKGTLDIIKEGLSQKNISDTRDVDALNSLIDSAKSQGFITDKHADVFKKRLNKIGENATEPSEEQLLQEEKDREAFKEETGMSDKAYDNITTATEITRDDLVEEATDNNASFMKFSNENVDELKRIKYIPIEDRTKEEQALMDKADSLFAIKENRDATLVKEYKNFSRQESKTNEAHSVLEEDWFYEDATEYNGTEMSQAFTDKEKKILGIC